MPGTAITSAVITKLKTIKPDVVFFGGYPPEMGLLLRQAKEQGLQTQFMGARRRFQPKPGRNCGPSAGRHAVTYPADFSAHAETKPSSKP